MTTSDHPVYDPSAIPRVDIDFMNDTHDDEIRLVNALGRLITACQSNPDCGETEFAAIADALQEWRDHSHAHFARENELMREFGFPAFPVHSGEHEAALGRLDALIDAWRSNPDIDQLASFVLEQWPQWFENHVNTMDMMTARFAVMQGYQP